jgi:hypothetical protein
MGEKEGRAEQKGAEGTSGARPRDQQKEAKERWSDSDLLYEFGFSTFILSLSTSALVHLGELPDPITNKKEVKLQLAKQTISVIEMLKEKTKGNLTPEEENLLDNVLCDVRLKYLSQAKAAP